MISLNTIVGSKERLDNLKASGINESNIMYVACERNDFELLKELDKKDIDYNYEKDSISPLLMAISHKNFQMVQYLIENGGNIEYRDSEGVPLICFAVEKESKEIFDYLLEKNAPLDIIDIFEESDNGLQLMISAISKEDNHYYKTLIERGVSVNVANENVSLLSTYIYRGEISKVALLLSLGADINLKTIYGGYPIMASIEMNDWEMLEYLMGKGAKLEKIQEPYGSYLHVASALGNLEIIDSLVEYGEDIDKLDSNGFSPLMTACECDDFNSVRKLLSLGADINLSSEISSPLSIIVDNENIQLLDYLIQKGAKVDGDYLLKPIFRAIEKNNLEILKYLISCGANLEIVDENSETPLIKLCKKNNFNINLLNELLKNKVSKDSRDSEGNTGAHYLVKNENILGVEKLIKEGCNLDIKNNFGETPLGFMDSSGNVELKKLVKNYRR